MNEVEKYGLFAVVAVAGLIAAIAWTTTEEPGVAALVPPAGTPLSIDYQSADDDGAADKGRSTAKDAAAAKLAVADKSGSKAGAVKPLAAAKGSKPAVKSTGRPSGKKLPVVRHIKPITPDDKAFTADEPPVAYPGSRSYKPPPGETATVASQRVTHTISEGETLGVIARTYYGSSSLYPQLIKLNPGLDPLKLQIGQVIVVKAGSAPPPEKTAAAKPPTRARGDVGVERFHVVKAGENLGTIAQQELGSVRFLDDLFEANRDILSSPDAISVGQRLRIPAR